jgi:hypothetical protein
MPSVAASLHKILGTGKFDLDKASQMAGWARELAGEHVPETEEYGIGSFVLREPRALHPRRFDHFLDQGSRPDTRQRLSVAGHTAGMGSGVFTRGQDRLGRTGGPLGAAYTDRVNEVVFIGRAMDRSAIEAAFAHCVLTDDEHAAGVAHGVIYPILSLTGRSSDGMMRPHEKDAHHPRLRPGLSACAPSRARNQLHRTPYRACASSANNGCHGARNSRARRWAACPASTTTPPTTNG